MNPHNKPLVSIEECLAASTMKPQDLFPACRYFCENYPRFTLEQSQDFLCNEHAVHKIKSALYQSLVSTAIQSQQLFDDALLDVKSFKSQKESLIQSYIELANQQNSPHLDYLHQSHPELMKRFYIKCEKEKKPQSQRLHNIVLRDQPKLLGHNTSWSDEKLISFLTQNKDHILQIIPNMVTSKRMASQAVNKAMWNIVIHKIVNANILDAVATLKSVMEHTTPDFFTHFMEISPKGFKNFFLDRRQYLSDRFKDEKHFEELVQIFQEYRFLFNEPFSEKIGLYNRKCPAMEVALKKEDYLVFYLWSNHIEDLKPQEQEMYCCACFEALLPQNDHLQLNSNWARKSMEKLSAELLKQYFSYASHLMENNDKKWCEKLIMEKNLAPPQAAGRRAKI